MTAKRSGKYRTYSHASHKRANLATDESAIPLDAERVSDETVELGLEDKSSYPRLVWDSRISGGGRVIPSLWRMGRCTPMRR